MTDLFTEETPEVEVTNSTDPVETIKSKFSKEGVVDVDALLKAKAESDRFIEQLKAEGKGVREELSKRISFEEALAKITATQNSNAETTNHVEPRAKNDDVHSVTTDDVRKMVAETLQTETKKATQEKNRLNVKTELQRTWGNDYIDKLTKVTRDLDISQEEADALAANKPKVFMKLVLGETRVMEAPSVFTPPRSQIIPTQNSSSGKKNYAYYKQMQDSTDSRVKANYWSPKTQNEMHKLASEMGDAFYN